MRAIRQSLQKQRGAALLISMLIVIVAMSAILLAALNADDLRTRKLVDTRAALAIARSALLDYALVNTDLHNDRSMSLPCPDIDGSGGYIDGEAHTDACGPTGETVMGRLPWKTLGLVAQKDATSACLWYVLSGSFKDAGSETAAMINADSNGQLQLMNLESGNIIEGLVPEDRPVAIVIAAMQPLTTQTRPGYVPGSPCSSGATPADYLDTDTISGISNAVLNGTADTIDVIATAPGVNEVHNDRVVTISRNDIAQRVLGRQDFQSRMRDLGLAVASCLANYGASNPGGSSDKRLPWPASTAMADYRTDTSYDDADNGFLSGRLPDVVADSNTATGNAIGRVLSDCDSAAVPEWTAAMRSRWQNWKDHFFYVVAAPYSPAAAIPSSCVGCLTVNGSGQYAALLLFSNSRLESLGQVRDAPPIDTDTKGDAANYLEGMNASNVPGTGTSTNYDSGPATNTFNDVLFCIDDELVASEC